MISILVGLTYFFPNFLQNKDFLVISKELMESISFFNFYRKFFDYKYLSFHYIFTPSVIYQIVGKKTSQISVNFFLEPSIFCQIQ